MASDKNRSQPGRAARPTPKRRPAAKRTRPLPQGEQFFTPGATGLRKTVEQRSATPMTFLFTQVPRWLAPTVLVILLLAGFAVTNWIGGVATLLVIAFVGWLAYLSWPSLRLGGRLLRIVVIVFLLAVAATRFGLL